MVKLIVPILIIGLGLVSDAYLFHRYINTTSVWRWTWWLPTFLIFTLFLKFLMSDKGMAEEYASTNIFLLLMGIFFIPKIMFAVFSLIPKIGIYLGGTIAISIIGIILYGITYGFSQFHIREITYESKDIPQSFDGYRIVQFSDVHSGSFYGPYAYLLQESMDAINALHPDMICFVGDIENFTPKELQRHTKAFSSLHAKDGVYTVMGNHDYSTYVKVSKHEKAALVQKTREMQKGFGWRMLCDENIVIKRGNDSITIIGEENWGLPPFPQFGNIKKATNGVSTSASIMLSHDPTAWRNHILKAFRPNITLSGHTHGSQFSLFGWSPASNIYDEWGGTYYDKECMLSVSTGLGGNFPFRFNMPREAVLITLKRATTP